MPNFTVKNIKHTPQGNLNTGFPKLVIGGSKFISFPDRGFQSKYEFNEWMYFEGPVVLSKNGGRYRVAASGLGGFSTAPFLAYYCPYQQVSGNSFSPAVGNYYSGAQIWSNYNVYGGVFSFSGARNGTYLCLAAGRVYSHYTPPVPPSADYWGGSWHYHSGSPGYWTTEITPSKFKRVD